MSASKESLRVFIALTESSPVPELWRAAMEAARGSPAEVVALFLHDERWQRAASLPFTQEVSKIGGATANFTLQRANEVLTDVVTRLRNQLAELASGSDYKATIEILAESEHRRVRTLVCHGNSVVIAPAALLSHPMYSELRALDVNILTVTDDSQYD